MTKDEFYKNATVSETEWWLNVEALPELVWGRLRVFSNGTADACFAEGVTLYGFENREQAANLLATDDLVRSSDLSEEDEEEYGISFARIETPNRVDKPDQEFVYTGTYPAPR